MPPKNKKQLQEEAKRLQEEQKRKQEEERRLEEQRRKYAAQKLGTGLVLPVSTQLIVDFASQQGFFINEKLREVLSKEYEGLRDEITIKQICKQMFYHIKNLKNLFELDDGAKPQQNEDKFLKVRVVCGIFFSLYLNNHPSISADSRKQKQDDENLLRRIILNHSQSKSQGQQKVFNKNQVIKVLSYFKEHYFAHFTILHKFRVFPKRQDHKTFNLHIASPHVQFNTPQTVFVDLSGYGKEPSHLENNEDKKSEE